MIVRLLFKNAMCGSDQPLAVTSELREGPDGIAEVHVTVSGCALQAIGERLALVEHGSTAGAPERSPDDHVIFPEGECGDPPDNPGDCRHCRIGWCAWRFGDWQTCPHPSACERSDHCLHPHPFLPAGFRGGLPL